MNPTDLNVARMSLPGLSIQKTGPETAEALEPAGVGAGMLRPAPARAGQLREPIRFRTEDGKEARVEMYQRNRAQPPVGSVVYVEDRAVAMSTYKYRRQNGKWMPLAARVTLFDEDGRPTYVVTHDLSKMRSEGTRVIGSLIEGATRLSSDVADLLMPQPLNAAVVFDEAECTAEMIALTLALAWEVAAGAALASAVAGCAFTGGVACPAVITATAHAAAATAALLVADAALEACYNQEDPPSGGVGAGQGEYSGDCWDVDWYISYDSGVTWHYIGSTQECG